MITTKAMLEQMLREATERIVQLRRDGIKIEQVPDAIDFAMAAANRDNISREIEGLALRAGRIREALEKVDGGTYGICSECEEAITPLRLDAVPWACLCIACQTAKETGLAA